MATGGLTVLRGGSVVDGTGAPGRRLDVAIRGEQIVEIGPTVRGDVEIDCAEMVVAPGFFDLHTHYDAQLLWDPACTSSCWHGVTTVAVGNCGFAIAPCAPEHRALLVQMLRDVEDMSPEALNAGIEWEFESFPEYLDTVRRRGIDLNIGAYVGHSAVRVAAMGPEAFERAATADEIDAMRALVIEAMDAGAIGFATSTLPSGRNAPSRNATPEESIALFHTMASTSRGVIATVPGASMPHEEIYRLQKEIGRPITWTALMSMANGRHEQLAELHRAAWAEGVDVRPQVSCRPQSGRSTLGEPFALRCPAIRELDGVDVEERARAYADPAWRDRARRELAESSVMPPRWDRWTVAESEAAPELEGRVVRDLAAERGVPELDLVLDLSLADGLGTWFGYVIANDDERAVAELLQLDGAVLGLSDAGAHPSQLCDAVLPTDLLGGWVRDRGVLGLEQAVHKLTGELADLLGIPDRGYLRPGAAADIVVFDPATIASGPTRRVSDQPDGSERVIADTPRGVQHVLVNGSFIRRDETQSEFEPGARPGRVVSPRKTT